MVLLVQTVNGEGMVFVDGLRFILEADPNVKAETIFVDIHAFMWKGNFVVDPRISGLNFLLISDCLSKLPLNE